MIFSVYGWSFTHSGIIITFYDTLNSIWASGIDGDSKKFFCNPLYTNENQNLLSTIEKAHGKQFAACHWNFTKYYIEMAIVKKLLIRPFRCNYGNNFIYKKIWSTTF